MTLELDTRSIPPAERAEALHAAVNAASKPTRVSVAGEVTGRLRVWPLQPGATLMSLGVRVDELTLTRSTRHLRQSDPGRLSVAVNLAGTCTTTNHGIEISRNDTLRLTDLASTYGIRQRGRCHAVAFEIDNDTLGLSVDQVRGSMPYARSSPLHRLLRQHLVDLARVVDDLAPQTRAAVGAATAELVGAMLRSVSPRDGDRRASLVDALPWRIKDYVRRHLDDPELTPARIAAEHNISVRYLYVLLSDLAETPEQWIITSRLAAARDDLVEGYTNVSSIAKRRGFKDPSHFTRRFRRAYGVTPSEFARQQAGPRDQGGAPDLAPNT